MNWFRSERLRRERSDDTVKRLTAQLDKLLAGASDPRETFSEFSRLLENEFDIRKGFLALRENDGTRFLAVSSWKKGGQRRRLSLRLPSASSLFEKVAETGQIYSETFAEFFDGNSVERNLLFDDETVSFVLRPLKYDARVVGLIGYSSDKPDAFVTIQDGQLDPAFDRLAAYLGTRQLELTRTITA